VGAVPQAVNGSRKRLEGESVKRWDLTHSEALSFICATCDSVMIHFLRKKMPLCFNHPRNPNVKLRSQKVGDLKYFEVRNVQAKEPGINV
jgi:hypothetical protein